MKGGKRRHILEFERDGNLERGSLTDMRAQFTVEEGSIKTKRKIVTSDFDSHCYDGDFRGIKIPL